MMGTSRSGVDSIAITKSDIASQDHQKWLPTPSSHLSFGDRLQAVQMNKAVDVPKLKGKLARSRSLALLGKANNSKGKMNSVLSTADLWKGIHFTKDIKAPGSEREHRERVLNRENTPFMTDQNILAPSFAPVKDKFVEKYIPLVEKSERRDNLEQLAQRSRDYLLMLNKQQNSVDQSFDRQASHKSFQKQKIKLPVVEQRP